MSRPSLLVTGGTGVLGREVVARLTAAGAHARVLSRRAQPGGRPDLVRGDLATGAGLAEAVAGVDTVVHCASNPRRPVDTEGTRRLLEAARAAGRPAVVYVSIVGVDRIPYSYYQAKLAAETYVMESGLPWTILRATQFHDLVLQILAALAKPPVAVVPRDVRAQPVDAGEVAQRLVELALTGPAGRAGDMGGPRVESVRDLLHAYLRAAGLRRRVLAVPLPGKTARGFRAGANLAPGGTRGTRTFEEFLDERVGPGRVQLSYSLRGRPRPSPGCTGPS